MPLISHKLQNYILPIGFGIIIFLMISTAFLTATRIEKNNKTIADIQIETNNINSLLSSMSDAVLQRSVILFEMFQSDDPFKTDDLKMELYKEATRFTVAREEYLLLDLSQKEKDLFSLQAGMSKKNASSITQLVDFLLEENHEQATMVLNNQTLPIMKQLLVATYELNKEAQSSAKEQVKVIKKISAEEINSILIFDFTTVLITLLLIIFLIRKQKQSNYDLSFLANTDTLTELPNRDNFIEQINHAILKEPDSGFSIIFFDVDYFKSINDIYGHELGDKTLQLFSKTITNMITPSDVLSRFGGDEFVLLLKNKKTVKNLTVFVKDLSNELDTSFVIDSNEVFVSASIVTSTYPADGSNAKQLLKNADIAMYAAKQAGRNCFMLFSLENSKKLEHEHALSHSLQTILKNKNSGNELSLVYQPLVNISNDSFNECEALIRWKEKDGSHVNTAEFIEIAEKSNLIQKVNMYVIEEACKQQYIWQKKEIPNIRININLSGNKRIFSQLFKNLSENLQRYDLSPELFGIELTERTMYEISEDTYKDLEYFRDLGMKISIDDFGTGYSSLSYLKNLPITSVKIDREFINGVPDDKIDVALVKAIITLSHSLGFDVVAEGVETQEQFDFLKSCNCNIAQGYLLHRPLDPEAISQLKLVA